jgi:fucose permease
MYDMDVVVNKKKQRGIIILFFFLSGILTATWSSRIPEIQQKLQLSDAALGTVLFVIPAGLVTGLSFASWLVVSFGSRLITLISCILCALALAFAGIASTTFLLMLVLFFMGIGRTVFNLSVNTGAIEVQQLYDRPIIASFHGIWSLACFIAAGISTGMIILDVEPYWHFPVVALLVIILTALFINKKNKHQRSGERRPFFVKPDKYLFLLGLMALCSMLCEGAMFDWSVNYFEKVVGANKTFVTTGYISFIVTMALGRLTGDRFIHAFGVYRMLMICGALMAAGFFTAAALPFIIPAAFGFFLIGAGSSVLVPIIYMLASRSKKMPASYALSSVTTIGYTGFLIGPLLIGNVSEWLGMPVAFFILSAVSLMIIFISIKVKTVSDV